MGNIIGSGEEESESFRYSHLKSQQQSLGNRGLSRTATGRYSTPNLKKKSSNENKQNKKEEIKNKDMSSKIIKEIFPKINYRNTITPTCFKISEKNNSHLLDELEIDKSKSCDLKNKSIEIKETGLKENLEFKEEVEIKNEKLFSDENKYEPEIDSSSCSRGNSITNSNLDTKKVNTEYELKFFKTGEEIRRSYIAKLIYKKVWPTEKEKDHNSLIIFDWDDTLLCTSFLTPNGIFTDDIKISDRDIEKIKKLEFSAANILKQAISKGDTYIITNAAPGWVEYSAQKFYPEVYKLLKQVTIVSARGEYEKLYPGDSRQWKILAFLEMLKNFDNSLVTNLICLGDSVIEMEAAHILASKFSHAYIKTIKFREAPKPEELNKQLNLVIDQFYKIYSAVKNLTIRVEKKSKDEVSTSKENNDQGNTKP
jgi:hypothetical protein